MASKKNKNLIIDKFWKKHNVTSKKTLILKKDFLGMLNELPLSEEPDYRRAVTKHRIGEVLLILARFPGLPFIKIKELTGHYNVILNRL